MLIDWMPSMRRRAHRRLKIVLFFIFLVQLSLESAKEFVFFVNYRMKILCLGINIINTK